MSSPLRRKTSCGETYHILRSAGICWHHLIIFGFHSACLPQKPAGAKELSISYLKILGSCGALIPQAIPRISKFGMSIVYLRPVCSSYLSCTCFVSTEKSSRYFDLKNIYNKILRECHPLQELAKYQIISNSVCGHCLKCSLKIPEE